MMNGEQLEMKVMEEVRKGRELAMQLQRLLMVNDDDLKKKEEKEQLAGKILDSFWNSLSILNNISSDDDSDDDHHQQQQQQRINSIKSTHGHSSSSGSHHQITTTTTSTSTSSRPKAPPPPTGTGRYKRRKCSDSDIRKKEHSTAYYDDGHAWRKYGQKIIHNNKFPRSYHRCTHRYDQGCRATKHIEMIQQNPPKYRTTYYGHHTCTSPQNHLQFLVESAHHDQSNTIDTNISSTNPNNNIINGNYKLAMLNFGSPISTTFQLPQSTSTLLPSTAVQVEDHVMMNKYRDDSTTLKDDDNYEDEQAVQLISQQQPPEYQALPPFRSDVDDNIYDSIDFTDLHDFLFS